MDYLGNTVYLNDFCNKIYEDAKTKFDQKMMQAYFKLITVEPEEEEDHDHACHDS